MNLRSDTYGRLVRAAWSEYRTHGFDAVKPATIAQRCNVSERTYYRHFPHPTDAAFAGAGEVRAALRAALVLGARALPPLPAVCSAVERVLQEASDGQRRHWATVITLTRTSTVLASRADREAANLINALTVVLERAGHSSVDSALAAHLGVQMCRRALDPTGSVGGKESFDVRIRQLQSALRQLVA